MTAEQFVDATGAILGIDAASQPAFDAGDRGDLPVRAALVLSDPLMRTLGRPNREQVVTARPDKLTMLVALDLMNGPVFANRLADGARSLRAQFARRSEGEIIDWLYRAAIGRRPTEHEQEIAREMLVASPTEEGLADLLWSLFMLPEFQLIR
jgi:hypothetical protein